MLTALASARRWLRSKAERERHAILARDLRESRQAFGRLADGAPEGDPRKTAWLVCSFPTVWGYKFEGVLSLALREKGFAPQPVHLYRDLWARRYHGIFSLGPGRLFRAAKRDTLASQALAAQFVDGPRQVSHLLSLTYDGVMAGRIALSNHLNRHKFAALNLRDEATVSSIARDLVAIASHVDAASALVAADRPSIVLMLEKGVTPMAELFGVCVREGIPVVQYAGAQRTDAYALKRYSAANVTAHPFSLDPSTWARVLEMPWSGADEDAIMGELEAGYRDGTWFNRKFLQSAKRIKQVEEVRAQLGLDRAKKTAVIFSHVLWDATFFYGDGLFEDYETWLIESVRAAAANPRLNWVVKLHPDLVWKLKYEGHTGELRDLLSIRAGVGQLPDHVKIVMPDTDLSTFSFFAVTDYCVTVRGTIGIEMACHGVPVITGGTGRYSGLGFTVDSASAAEYLGRLAALDAEPPMTAEARTRARRYAHAVFRQRPWHLRSFQTVKSIDMVGHPLDHNLLPHVRTYDELVAAPDMRAFASWVDSTAVDYLEDIPCAAS